MLGSINQEGFLKNLDRKGFNIPKSLGELYANSIDAGATVITTYNGTNEHMLIDNGRGMNRLDITNMFDFYRANHVGDESIGISGMGAKASLKKLSLNRECSILTKKQDEDGFKVTVPWDKMVEHNKYEGMVICEKMTDDDMSIFKTHLDTHGTIIIIPYSECLDFELTNQFTNSKTILNPTERIDCVFSKFKQVVFKYTSRDKIIDQLDMYDFFGGEKRDYYTGIDSNVIKIYKTNRGYDYVLDKNDTHLSIQRSGPGWGKEPTEYHHHMTKQCVGSFKINVAVRAHNDYFNPEKPKCPTVYSKLYGYDAGFFDNTAVQREHLAKPYLVRNGHTIGKFNLETIKFNAGRGGGKSCLQALKTRAEIEYSTPSNHENIYDEIFSIQENKNQLNDESVPKQIIRLIEYCIKQHSNNVWDYFTGRIEEIETQEIERKEKVRLAVIEQHEKEQQAKIEKEEEERRKKIEHEKEERLKAEADEKVKLELEKQHLKTMTKTQQQAYIEKKKTLKEEEERVRIVEEERVRIEEEERVRIKEEERLRIEEEERLRIEEEERVRVENEERLWIDEQERLREEEEERLREEKIKLDRYFDGLSPTDTINDKLLKLSKFMKEHYQTVYTVEIYEKIIYKLATTIENST